MASKIQVGDRVRLTAKFLRSTGQYTGPEAQSVWTVVGIEGRWAVTNQEHMSNLFSPEELAADPTLAFRRIGLDNLQKAK
jgi:hypothetical protein